MLRPVNAGAIAYRRLRSVMDNWYARCPSLHDSGVPENWARLGCRGCGSSRGVYNCQLFDGFELSYEAFRTALYQLSRADGVTGRLISWDTLTDYGEGCN